MPNEITKSQPKDIRSFIAGYGDQFRNALPRFLTPERFIRITLTCLNKNPKLLQCTRESLLACLFDCAQLGIEPDGRRAHLIPFNDRRNNRVICTLIIDYKGLAELVRRSGEVATLHAGIVYPSDSFDYAFGTDQFLKHKPSLTRSSDEAPIAAYSYVKLKDGQEDFDVMGIEEVQKVRKRSRAASDGPWVTDFDEMAKKTVFRRHSKWLPLSPELREKIEKDDEPMTDRERFADAKIVGVAGVGTEGIRFDLPPEESVTPNAGLDLPAEGESDQTGVLAVPPPNERKTRTRKAKEEAPPRATPIQGLRNLIASAPIDEEDLRRYLVTSMIIEPHQKLDDLSEEKLGVIINDFTKIAEVILGERDAS